MNHIFMEEFMEERLFKLEAEILNAEEEKGFV
jgi:hypothetical protein